ncbi:A/G-specific adenine glycosylase [Alkalicaulis satelles]|uniref:Adenine DNA glycosylase n=1 Tax=Alkalicaulis satelles TaxID=2609175 RepID=A0A5M6ZLN9_9PROT|nr:A/G-specific adenine glycosylase [Alkalicaulis satelles]KAA5805240.1 A/G-specific adenine glycosylase [Alkalicaulis satelles]
MTPALRGDAPALRAALLEWYDRQGRTLPWRVRPEDRARGVAPDPYAVWLSEIMLQQTTVPHAAPYWARFLQLWPRIEDLADAPREDVMREWAGLGYYARARNLHACAQMVASQLGGRFPSDLDGLRALPGIGEYTANAIRAAAFDLPASVVDGNVERVITRLFAMEAPLSSAKPAIRKEASRLADPDRPGDYAQAIMDLGATVCTPKNPSCGTCPWARACAARAQGDPLRYPVKPVRKPKPVRHGLAFVILRGGAGRREVYVRPRPDKGLLGGMLETPGSEWLEDVGALPSRDAAAPAALNWRKASGVSHVFTHFALELTVYAARAPKGWRGPDAHGRWVPAEPLSASGLPSVMKKAVRAALG